MSGEAKHRITYYCGGCGKRSASWRRASCRKCHYYRRRGGGLNLEWNRTCRASGEEGK